jgi:lysophospholipase L1-like esterase
MCLALALAALGVPTAPVWAQPRIMIIGDSIQSGTGLRRVTQQASYLLQGAAGVVVHNFASPGARMTDVFFGPGMNQAGVAVQLVYGFFGMRGLVVALGTNDWWGNADLTVFRQAYADFLAGLPPMLPVACLSPPWMAREVAPNDNGAMMDDFRETIREVCAAAGKAYLDGKAAIPNDVNYFVPDGMHPNKRGHRAMAKFLKTELDRLGWLP